MAPDELANACAQALWQGDETSRHFGMQIDHVGPGEAILSMDVAVWMVNGHATCHGGCIFTLADSAFAFACNSYNQSTVAQIAYITFISPAFSGDRLTATARELSRRGRSGVYDIQVANQNGERIAEFRGHSRTIKGTLLPHAG